MAVGLSPILIAFALEACEGKIARRIKPGAGASDTGKHAPSCTLEGELAELAELIERGDPRDMRRIAELLRQGVPDPS